jgi:hypothetical protein
MRQEGNRQNYINAMMQWVGEIYQYLAIMI